MTVNKYKTEIHTVTEKNLTLLMKMAVSHLGNVYKVGCSIPLLIIKFVISYTFPFYNLNMHILVAL